MSETPGALQDPPDEAVKQFEQEMADKVPDSTEKLEPEKIKTESENLRNKATSILKTLNGYNEELHRQNFEDPHKTGATKEIRFLHNGMHLGVLINNGHESMVGNDTDRNSLTIALYPSPDKDSNPTLSATILTPREDNLKFPGSFSYSEVGQNPIADSMLSGSRIEEFLDTIADPPPPQGSL